MLSDQALAARLQEEEYKQALSGQTSKMEFADVDPSGWGVQMLGEHGTITMGQQELVSE